MEIQEEEFDHGSPSAAEPKPNPKSEARNPKQTPNPNDRNAETPAVHESKVFIIRALVRFEFVSDFVFRASDLKFPHDALRLIYGFRLALTSTIAPAEPFCFDASRWVAL